MNSDFRSWPVTAWGAHGHIHSRSKHHRHWEVCYKRLWSITHRRFGFMALPATHSTTTRYAIGQNRSPARVMLNHPDRLFPPDPAVRDIARGLYASIRYLPIVSPHGHTQAAWFALNQPFPDPASLFVQPDHYIFRMLYSQGISLEDLAIGRTLDDPQRVWRIFGAHYHLFRGTPTRLWLDYAFHELFGLQEALSEETADHYFDVISAKLRTPEFRPRALYERFRIEVLATTDSPLDSLAYHQQLKTADWKNRILPTFRPDPVVDPDYENFHANNQRLGEMTHEDTGTWEGYLSALRSSRQRFRQLGCTATDHGHPTAHTENLSGSESSKLFAKVLAGKATAEERERFRGQMLTEMARMSLEDGLVMQLHAGSYRNHNRELFQSYGRDVGADIPQPTDYVHALKPLLDAFGNDRRLTIILFTLDESTYTRELAPLAGHYPCLRLGPPWWFHDSPEGMLRFRNQVIESAGFYNTVGFNDDTRAFLSIPARHDMARRVDCSYLARLVAEHRLAENEALELAYDLSYRLVKEAYRL